MVKFFLNDTSVLAVQKMLELGCFSQPQIRKEMNLGKPETQYIFNTLESAGMISKISRVRNKSGPDIRIYAYPEGANSPNLIKARTWVEIYVLGK